jgi:spore maturation protein B
MNPANAADHSVFTALIIPWSELLSSWIVPALILFVVTYAYIKKVRVYEVFVEGAKEGFDTAVMIIPYLVAIFAAIALFRASGALDFLGSAVGNIISPSVLPPEVLIMSLMKPMSGSGARGMMLDVFSRYGVDSYPGFLASAVQGSTETTFYVIAVYFGAIGVKNTRYTIGVGLAAEVVAVVVGVVCSVIYWRASH